MVNQYCAHSFARNWQLPFLNQRKGENDRRKYFMINLHERMLPTSAGVEPATSWSPVGRASNCATEAGDASVRSDCWDISIWKTLTQCDGNGNANADDWGDYNSSPCTSYRRAKKKKKEQNVYISWQCSTSKKRTNNTRFKEMHTSEPAKTHSNTPRLYNRWLVKFSDLFSNKSLGGSAQPYLVPYRYHFDTLLTSVFVSMKR